MVGDGNWWTASTARPNSWRRARMVRSPVTTVAATSDEGIYLREVVAGRGITVDTVTVSVDRARFDSGATQPSRTLEDLTTTTDGPIKLVAEAGVGTIAAGVAKA